MVESDNYKILLVDDETDILEFISYNLRKEGFLVSTASNGEEALRIARTELPHLIILDVMMPGMDGIETSQEIKKIPSLANTLIAFLTARGEDYSQIAGFDAGADDYISKPIKPKVLISRIRALLKRFSPLSTNPDTFTSGTVAIGSITIDRQRFIVTVRGEELILPKKEFELLELLVSKPDKVFTREEIYNTIWGDNIIVGDRTIDVHIRKLREKIGQDNIRTIKGVGYKFVE